VARSAVRAWLDAYARAWRERDPEAAAGLFTEGALYRSSPFRAPHRAREGVRCYWRDAVGPQRRIEVRFGEPVLEGRRAAVEWWTTAEEPEWGPPREDPAVTLAGCMILRFDSAGLCEELRESWNVEFGGRLDPHPGWGR
jgi:SnoaL-like domain